MTYYPVFLDLKGRLCAVIGGGVVAERKVLSLIKAGALVTVISPILSEVLTNLSEKTTRQALESDIPSKDCGKLNIIQREYIEGDLKGFCLVYAATDNDAVNKLVRAEAQREHILLNVVDRPDMCDFIVPSVAQSGRLSIAVSTSGASPSFARLLREKLEQEYGEEYAVFLDIMASIRQFILTKSGHSDSNRKIFHELASSGIPELIRRERWDEIQELVHLITGEHISLDQNGIRKG